MKNLFWLYIERSSTLKRTVVDYTDVLKNKLEFSGLIKAQGYGNQFRALLHLDKFENIKIDNDIAEYKLIIKVLENDCENPDDKSWMLVKFEDEIFLSRLEVEQFILFKNKISLFDYFKEY